MAQQSRATPQQVVRDYVSRMCTDVKGMKVLVMDAETTGIVSMVYTQTQILQHEVFLIDAIERERTDKMPHLKAVYFLRPTAENIRRLQEEFKDPKYGEYHLFFSNITRDGQIQQLAEADEHEVVQQVQEYFADFLAVGGELFSLGLPSVAGLSGAVWDQSVFDRAHQGICALLLALKKRPAIRYQRNSEMALRIAETLLGTLDTESDLFASRRPDVPPLLLVLDRRDDPVTPLLNQWTYQAMVHELVGINNNRVDLRGAPSIPKECEQIVLSAEQDAFFADNMLVNYGDLAENVKALLEAFQAKSKVASSKEMDIAEMQKFVEAYPQFRKLSGDVSKHVTLLGEINRLVEVGCLMEVSQVEQELACTEEHTTAISEVERLLHKSSISDANKLRLVLLYALRYEKEPSNRISHFTDLLGPEAAQAVSNILQHCGAATRSGDLFSNKTWLAATKKSLQRNLKAVENVYTQHTPYLAQTLESLLKGGLSEAAFPQIGSDAPPSSKKRAPTEIIVFMMGGVTFEEARYVAEMNTANPGVRVMLGGTTIHNSTSFLEELERLAANGAPPQPMGPAPAAACPVPGLSSMGSFPPLGQPISTKRISALASSSLGSMQANMSAAISKLQ